MFELIGKRATGKGCPLIDGIAEEAEEMIAESGGSPVGDAGAGARAEG